LVCETTSAKEPFKATQEEWEKNTTGKDGWVGG
jgi:hypothetical protein